MKEFKWTTQLGSLRSGVYPRYKGNGVAVDSFDIIFVTELTTLGKLNSKWPLSILILSFIAALTSCSEENDFKNAKAGSSESDVDSSGGDYGGSSSTLTVISIEQRLLNREE